jgi:hypothetical protein
MIKLMNELPDNVLGVSAEGKITGADYETILIPAVEIKLKAYKKIRLLYHLGAKFTEFELSAMLDDTKIGMKHLSQWDKIALVSDHQFINIFAKFFGYMLSCEIRIFPDADLAEAKKWVCE